MLHFTDVNDVLIFLENVINILKSKTLNFFSEVWVSLAEFKLYQIFFRSNFYIWKTEVAEINWNILLNILIFSMFILNDCPYDSIGGWEYPELRFHDVPINK